MDAHQHPNLHSESRSSPPSKENLHDLVLFMLDNPQWATWGAIETTVIWHKRTPQIAFHVLRRPSSSMRTAWNMGLLFTKYLCVWRRERTLHSLGGTERALCGQTPELLVHSWVVLLTEPGSAAPPVDFTCSSLPGKHFASRRFSRPASLKTAWRRSDRLDFRSLTQLNVGVRSEFIVASFSLH